jgi:putative intracellular protease/amidase
MYAMPAMPAFTTALHLVPTHAFEDSPELDILIIPRGHGLFRPRPTKDRATQPAIVDPIVKFIKQRYPKLQCLMTVCTGAGIAARTGLLDRTRDTTFKGAFSATKQWRPEVQWVHSARWVMEGNIWTRSRVCAGTDLTRM